MTKLGPEVEIHPFVRIASRHFGSLWGPMFGLLGKAAAGMYVTIYLKRWARHIFLTASAISFWAAWYNIWGANIPWYTPNILCWPNIMQWMNW